ncbi:hypothetical protein QBC33DRAFT_153223 [Phialemonium atrogriseum]|uniref:Uncharacterized protein n=1 Tax=Phialemonium atrogriseum TaxID=1093897 RepID=A0AAJ0C773_9PEZI|nr:uncharacterized protein QBC33DRAFT_153223 [Phialemonium atrogriseum]KAK1771414.1 hypothetical protein QBC33DRAFT_153223 [Phialemonium atrogriseum]
MRFGWVEEFGVIHGKRGDSKFFLERRVSRKGGASIPPYIPLLPEVELAPSQRIQRAGVRRLGKMPFSFPTQSGPAFRSQNVGLSLLEFAVEAVRPEVEIMGLRQQLSFFGLVVPIKEILPTAAVSLLRASRNIYTQYMFDSIQPCQPTLDRSLTGHKMQLTRSPMSSSSLRSALPERASFAVVPRVLEKSQRLITVVKKKG